MKRFVWMTLPVMLLCFACNERDTSTTEPVVTKTPDIVTTEEGTTAAFFDAANPHTRQMIVETLADPSVASAIESFNAAGYALAPEYSFYVEGKRDDGGEVEITTLVMENSSDPSHDAVYLFCLHGIDKKVVVPLTLTFSKETPGTDFEQIGENTWLGLSGVPSTANAAGAGTAMGERDLLAARLGWREWLRCVGERLFAGGVSCALVCRFAPTAYVHCVTVCTAGHAVYAFIQCSMAQL